MLLAARLVLTPAYGRTPSQNAAWLRKWSSLLPTQPRSTSVSNQAIAISRDGRRASQLWLCRVWQREFLNPYVFYDQP